MVTVAKGLGCPETRSTCSRQFWLDSICNRLSVLMFWLHLDVAYTMYYIDMVFNYPNKPPMMLFNPGQTGLPAYSPQFLGNPDFWEAQKFLSDRGVLSNNRFLSCYPFGPLRISAWQPHSRLQSYTLKHHKQLTTWKLWALTFIVRVVLHSFWNFQKLYMFEQGFSKPRIFWVFYSNKDPLIPRCRPHLTLQSQPLIWIKLTHYRYFNTPKKTTVHHGFPGTIHRNLNLIISCI